MDPASPDSAGGQSAPCVTIARAGAGVAGIGGLPLPGRPGYGGGGPMPSALL